MLYPKKNEPQLTEELFQNPTSEYRGAPFWAWNCELDEEELLWQLDVLKKMGFGGAHMHVRTGMETEYLSDAHMSLVKACVDKSQKENMLAWLYDEDRWPSGAAGGFVTKDVRYRNRFLLFTCEPVEDIRPISEAYGSLDRIQLPEDNTNIGLCRADNGYFLACFDIVLSGDGTLESYRMINPNEQAEGKKWYAYVQTPVENPWYNNQTYVDTLSKEAIQKFIEVTYNRYLETVGDSFGSVVPAMFTDEPQVSKKHTLGFADESKDVFLPWTDDLPLTFRDEFGLELVENLPQLLWEIPGGNPSVIRYRYHDHVCRRFVEAFADQCGKWCADHGLMLTGHMMQEPTLESQTKHLGEALRCYRNFQLPGIDMLCNRMEFTTAKQAQSAVHQYGREGMLSELYGVTGWDFDFRGHKFHGDWQAALGVTLRVPHLSWVSMKGEAKRDYPASIHYQSPWWKDYSVVEDHFARVNTAMVRGKPCVRVGVIHPIESYWLHFGPAQQTAGIRKQLDEGFQNITRWLLEGLVDFDFVSESLLPELCSRGDAPLCVGEMAYDAIVVPGCETLRSSTLERLEAFADEGGKLIFVGDAPKYENAEISARGEALWSRCEQVTFAGDAVLRALEGVRSVDIRGIDGARTDNLVHQLRLDGEDKWLFVAHSRLPYEKDFPVKQEIIISVEGEYVVSLFDTQSGEIYTIPSKTEQGKTIVNRSIYDLDSLLLRFSKKTANLSEPSENTSAGKRLPVSKLARYSLDEDNVYLLDKAEVAIDDGPYSDETELLMADNELRRSLGWPLRKKHVAQPWVIDEPIPEHSVRMRFRVLCDREFEGIKLGLEDSDVAQVTFNGEKIRVEPDGWFTDKSVKTVKLGTLLVGENVIEVQIPFGRRTNIEWCYLLGDFGVKLLGEHRMLTKREEFLGFDDIVYQGLAHYGGNITYEIPVETNGGDLRVTVPHYVGAGVRVELENQKDYILYPPYSTVLTDVSAGAHTLKLTLLGNRANCFGAVHLADPKEYYLGNKAWRYYGRKWTDSYRLKIIGIRSAPIIEELEI